jgi:phosphatidylglycerophosphate synthase
LSRDGIRGLRRRCQPDGLDLSLYRRVLVRRVSIHLTSLLDSLGVTANQVSAAKGVLAVAGAAMFAGRSVAWPVAGVMLLQLSYLLDACDGELARLHESCATAGGEYVDKVGDVASRGLQHLCWGLGAYRLGGRLWVLAVGGVLACLWLVVRFCVVETVLESLASHPEAPPSDGERSALRRCFVRTASSGRMEYVLSVLYHPWINLVTLAVAVELAVGTVSAAGVSIRTRSLSLLAFAAVWSVNLLRKLRSGYRTADFRRPERP